MGKFAHGTTFSLGGTAVGELTNIEISGRSRDAIDTTDHDSSGDMEFIAGLRDGGEVTLTGHLPTGSTGDTGHDALETNYTATGSAAIEEGIISLADNAGASATTYTFDCFVTEAPVFGSPHDGKYEYTCTLKITGGVTKAKASAA